MKYYGLVFLAACLWGAIGVMGRSAFQSGMSPLEVSFWRAAISASLFLAHAILTRQLWLQRRHDALLFILFGLLAVSLFNASYFLAVQSGGVTLATIMMYTAPAFVAVVGHFLFGERLSAHKIFLMGLTSGGIAYQLYYAGLRHLEASRAVLVASIEPVVAAGLAALLYGEQLSWAGYVGAALVVGSAIASSINLRPSRFSAISFPN